MHNHAYVGFVTAPDRLSAVLEPAFRCPPTGPTIYCLGCCTARPETDYHPSDLAHRRRRCVHCRRAVQRSISRQP